MRIEGTTWLVTGASSGIGAAIAAQAAARGAKVIGVARRAAELAAVVEPLGGIGVVADLADRATVDAFVDRVEAEHGPIDVLVNNAGVDTVGAFTDATADDVRFIHEINLITPIELCRQTLPRMIERGRGHLVNVSSMASSAGFPGMSLYCSSKSGLSSFHRVLRAELRGSAVGLTVVEIGPIPTDMLDRVYAYPPTRHGFDRLRRLQMMPEVSRDKVAIAISDAVASGDAAVRLPARAAAFPWITSTPQRIVGLLTAGRRPTELSRR